MEIDRQSHAILSIVVVAILCNSHRKYCNTQKLRNLTGIVPGSSFLINHVLGNELQQSGCLKYFKRIFIQISIKSSDQKLMNYPMRLIPDIC